MTYTIFDCIAATFTVLSSGPDRVRPYPLKYLYFPEPFTNSLVSGAFESQDKYYSFFVIYSRSNFNSSWSR